ncbi:WPP domain-interacting tail-anchored protein 1-like [Wolffia australiana]
MEVDHRELLTNIELEVAYCSEKVLNLDMLLMNIENQMSDYESVPSETTEKTFEYDLLAGILDSELDELKRFIESLQEELIDARRTVFSSHIENQLSDAEASLKQSQDHLAEIRTHFAKFQRVLTLGEMAQPRNGEEGLVSLTAEKWKMQTAEQQRHVLQMLEKSLARELDLERRLFEAEREASSTEESMAAVLEQLFEADNTSVVMMETSKKLVTKLEEAQFTLTCSLQRENEMRSKLQKLSESKGSDSDRRLIEQVNLLRAALQDSQERFSRSTVALKNQVYTLEKKLSESEKLAETNSALFEELESTKMEFSKEKELLNRQRRDSEVERRLLKKSVEDLETLIENLKKRVSEAEAEAQGKQLECSSLAEANSKLREELAHAERAQMAAAKNIGIETQLIHKLVMKVSSERERLQAQVCRPAKEEQSEVRREKMESSEDEGMKEVVRSIDAGLLGPKKIIIAVLILSISVIGFCVFHRS